MSGSEEAGYFTYFAFGSNLLKERLQLANPTARFCSTGRLKVTAIFKMDMCVYLYSKWPASVMLMGAGRNKLTVIDAPGTRTAVQRDFVMYESHAMYFILFFYFIIIIFRFTLAALFVIAIHVLSPHPHTFTRLEYVLWLNVNQPTYQDGPYW